MQKTLMAILIATYLASAAFAQEPCSAAMVVEPETGTILYEQNADQALPTASMTKMMTLLLVLEEIEAGRLDWSAPVSTSARASKMGGSQVYLRHGETFSVRDMVAATMVHSANDAALALAEHVGGTADAFVTMMNRRAEELGLEDTEYYSPHGLPGEAGQKDDVMTPRDLARLGSELMKHPEMRRLAVLQTMPFRDGTFTMVNPNHLLRLYSGATGIKTGYHGKAGFCVTASARRGPMELIAVVMGCDRKQDSFQRAATLLTEAFHAHKKLVPLVKGKPLEKPLSIREGEKGAVPVVAGATVPILAERRSSPKLELLVSSTHAVAPIQKGQQVGWIVVRKDGTPIARVPALAAADVERAGWFSRTWDRVWPF